MDEEEITPLDAGMEPLDGVVVSAWRADHERPRTTTIGVRRYSSRR